MAAPWTVRSAALLAASLLTSVRMVVFGRDVEGRWTACAALARLAWRLRSGTRSS